MIAFAVSAGRPRSRVGQQLDGRGLGSLDLSAALGPPAIPGLVLGDKPRMELVIEPVAQCVLDHRVHCGCSGRRHTSGPLVCQKYNRDAGRSLSRGHDGHCLRPEGDESRGPSKVLDGRTRRADLDTTASPRRSSNEAAGPRARLHFLVDSPGRMARQNLGGPRRTPAQRPTWAPCLAAARDPTENHSSAPQHPS